MCGIRIEWCLGMVLILTSVRCIAQETNSRKSAKLYQRSFQNLLRSKSRDASNSMAAE